MALNRLLVFGGLAAVTFIYIEHKKKAGVPALPGVKPVTPALPAKAVVKPKAIAPGNIPIVPGIAKPAIAKLNHIQVDPIPTGGLVLVKPPVAGYAEMYSATIPNANKTVRLMLTAADPLATIRVNGIVLRPNTWSAPIALKVGKTLVKFTCTAQDGRTTAIYGINFNRLTGALKGLDIF